jgi:hypothetical protein
VSKKVSWETEGVPTNRELAEIVRLLVMTMDARSDRAQREFVDVLGKGVARSVFPLLFYGLANVLERDGVSSIAVSFEKIAEISKVDARARGSTDYWRDGESVRQAFLKFRRRVATMRSEAFRRAPRQRPAEPLPSITIGTLRVQLFLSRSARTEPSLTVGVLLSRLADRDGGVEHGIDITETAHNFTRPAIRDFFINDIARERSHLELRSIAEGVPALRSLLFREPITLIVDVVYEFDRIPENVRMIDWGDGHVKAPGPSRVLRHAYREPGTYSITLSLAGKQKVRYESAVKVLSLRTSKDPSR